MDLLLCGYFLGIVTILMGVLVYNISLDLKALREHRRKEREYELTKKRARLYEMVNGRRLSN